MKGWRAGPSPSRQGHLSASFPTLCPRHGLGPLPATRGPLEAGPLAEARPLLRGIQAGRGN